MEKLTLEKSKQLFEKISPQIKPESQRDFLIIHSEKVGRLAKLIGEKSEMVNDVFEIAGWVHDLGYVKDFAEHANYSIPIIEEAGYKVDDILRDCILNHGNEKIPVTVEGKLFQIADKLSIFDLDVIALMLKHGTFPLKEDDVTFLKMMSEKSFELLKNFD